jgi:hypothetical protein
MINLHERLSEYSYGYGVTREYELRLTRAGLRPTPFLPSLLHEGELGFDVGFKTKGRVVALQFKLGQELQRFRRSTKSPSIPSPLRRPFWRFTIDTRGHQFKRLIEFEKAGAEVLYVAPRFSTWIAYDQAFQDGEVVKRSLTLKPSKVLSALRKVRARAGDHRIIYDKSRRYVCSDPIAVPEEDPDRLAVEIAVRVREGYSLERQIRALFERQRETPGPGRLPKARQRQIFTRARSRIEAMAAVVSLEAWSQGAQVIFVTDIS